MSTPSSSPTPFNLGYRFHNPALLADALTHKSYCNENPQEAPTHNERLEFLGDAVLSLVVSELLMAQFPAEREGRLSKMRASLVSESSLAEVARELGLGGMVRMGRGEERSGGKEKDSILADALEAVVAAVYLDSRGSHGLTAVSDWLARLFSRRLDAVAEQTLTYDFKTRLQEIVQKSHRDTVEYRVVEAHGPDHDKWYTIAVVFQGKELGRGQGRNKKQAEQMAAQGALKSMERGEITP
ncbi:MAG: ribonuclease III [Deltaproteobacteria bacterium]|nr:ribonuclease III [Deltaproteobacteria bacterium]